MASRETEVGVSRRHLRLPAWPESASRSSSSTPGSLSRRPTARVWVATVARCHPPLEQTALIEPSASRASPEPPSAASADLRHALPVAESRASTGSRRARREPRSRASANLVVAKSRRAPAVGARDRRPTRRRSRARAASSRALTTASPPDPSSTATRSPTRSPRTCRSSSRSRRRSSAEPDVRPRRRRRRRRRASSSPRAAASSTSRSTRTTTREGREPLGEASGTCPGAVGVPRRPDGRSRRASRVASPSASSPPPSASLT